MNLKVEDLEKEFQMKNQMQSQPRDQRSTEEQLMEIEQLSVSSTNLIQQSMKDALLAMTEAMDSARSSTECANCGPSKPSKKYERIIQKLESDIRGHIRVSVAQA